MKQQKCRQELQRADKHLQKNFPLKKYFLHSGEEITFANLEKTPCSNIEPLMERRPESLRGSADSLFFLLLCP